MSDKDYAQMMSAPIQAQQQQMRVLVYDDNEEYATECAEALSYLGYQAIIRNTRQTFIEQVRNFLPHYIVLDIHMPGFDGLEALQALRNLENGPDGIIIVSAAGPLLLSAARKIAEAHQIKLLAIFDKPFAISDFQKAISAHST